VLVARLIELVSGAVACLITPVMAGVALSRGDPGESVENPVIQFMRKVVSCAAVAWGGVDRVTMARDLKRVRLEPDTNILEDVHADKVPRLIERGGEALAVVVAPEEDALGAGPPKSRQLREKLLSHAGAWRDLDAEHMIEELYRARRESPSSAPVEP
jgi:hypothetical protein